MSEPSIINLSEPSIINRLRLEYVTCFRQLKRSGLEAKDGQDSADGDGSLTGRQIGNSLDDSAPAEDAPLGSEKSCTVKSQAAQEMQEMQGSQCPQGALRLEVFAKDGQDSADGDGSLTGRQIGNSLDDSAPAEDSPLGSEKSCTVKSQAAQEMLEMQGNQSPQGAPRAAAESFSEVNGEASQSLTARQAAQEMLEMQGNQSPRGAPRAAAESFSEVNGEGSKVTPKTLHFYIGDGTDVSDVPFDVSTFFLFGNLFGHRSKGHSFAVLRATALAPAEFEALVDALEILKKARIETTFNPQRASVTSIMALVAKTAGDRCSLQCLRFGGDHGHHTFAKNVPEGRGFLVNARRGASLRCCACANCPGPRQTCDGCGKNFHFHPENFYIAEKSIEFALCETCSTGSPEP